MKNRCAGVLVRLAWLTSALLRLGMCTAVCIVCNRSHLVHSLIGGVVTPHTGLWCIVFVADAQGGITSTVTATGSPLDPSDGFHSVRRCILATKPSRSTSLSAERGSGDGSVADNGLQFVLASIFDGLAALGFCGVKDDMVKVELLYSSEAYMATRKSIPSMTATSVRASVWWC